MDLNIKSVKSLIVFITVIFIMGFRADISSGELHSVGTTNAQTNFPFYYSDTNGLALELCLTPPDAGPPCFFDPVIAGNTLSAATGFGGEAFWFLSEASIDQPSVSGLLVMAVEAAYGAGDPAPDTQISFSRIRIRVDVLNGTPAGTYTITHPYGVNTYADLPACATDPGELCNNVINETIDVGVGAPGDFTGALKGRVGPFLTMDPTDPSYAAIRLAWPAYIGDLNTPVKVLGSPFGTNYFRIQGPGGIDVIQSLFTLMGKLYTGTIPTPLSVERASYSRTAAPGNPGHIDLFATSAALAALNVSGDGIPSTPLAGDGTGRFFIHIPLASATTVPATLTVTADNSAIFPNNTQTSVPIPLTDFVTVGKAEYNPVSGNLTIAASSGDEAPPPALTAAGFSLTDGLLVLSTTTPSSIIQVLSSAGGAESRKVRVLRPQ
ncbi:MAG: hypothetical protein WAV13_15535 [Thermodesulfovibrionales bacterium]